MDNSGSCKPSVFKACVSPGNKNLLKIILPGKKKNKKSINRGLTPGREMALHF